VRPDSRRISTVNRPSTLLNGPLVAPQSEQRAAITPSNTRSPVGRQPGGQDAGAGEADREHDQPDWEQGENQQYRDQDRVGVQGNLYVLLVRNALAERPRWT
jgi:hypothetical protein